MYSGPFYKKTICDKCKRKRGCNTFDKTRGTACIDFEKNPPNQATNKQKEQEK